MALHPRLVGQRVVVRRLLPGETGASGGPAMTDVIGVLEFWGEHEIAVRRRDGRLVTIELAHVVAGKPVPPPPERRPRQEQTNRSSGS